MYHCGLSVSPSVCLPVCHSVSKKDCCKPISLKLGVMTGPTNWKKWLPFGGDPLVDTDSGSLFSTSLATARHGILGGLLPFLIQSPATFMTLGKMTDANKVTNPQQTAWSKSGSLLVEIRRLGGGLHSLESLLVEVRHLGGGLHSLGTV